MMKCSFCGFNNDPSSIYCEQCRTDLSVPDAAMNIEAGTEVQAIVLVGELVVESIDPEYAQTRHFEKIPLVEVLEVQRLVGESIHPSSPNGGTDPAAASLSPVQGMQLASLGSAPTLTADPLAALPREAKPRLVVLRGEKIDLQYPLYSGKNYLGRTDEKPVDIDLENQEPADRIWTSRQHAVITFENGLLTIEDLNSLNGTFVNRARVHPGQIRTLQVNDIIQVGTVQMRMILV